MARDVETRMHALSGGHANLYVPGKLLGDSLVDIRPSDDLVLRAPRPDVLLACPRRRVAQLPDVVATTVPPPDTGLYLGTRRVSD